MTFQINESMDWTDHFVEYGFAVRKGLVDRAFCDEAIEQVRRIVGDDRPLDRWTVQKPGQQFGIYFFQDPGRTGWTEQNPVLEKVYDHRRLRAAVKQLYGDSGDWDGVRNYYVFLNPHNPDGKAELSTGGHIDFGGQPIPILYRGFTFQVALLDTVPFSGNISIFPGTHKTIMKMLIDDPDITSNGSFDEVAASVEPYEFVAEAGDVMFMHHLVVHSTNPCHSSRRTPRIPIHAESFRAKWLTVIDPDKPNLSPWERSLAHHGFYEVQRDEARHQRQEREKHIHDIEQEKGIQIDEKWKRYSDWPDPLAWQAAGG